MELSTKIFEPERYTYNDYKLWEGNWELVNGYPYAMSPSPNRNHQSFGSKFIRAVGNLLEKEKNVCKCEVFYELDWIVNDNTVVRPDCMIVCGEQKNDFITSPPQLILEIASQSTKLRDRNTKFLLYEMYGVQYYLMADCDAQKIEVYELIDNKYKQINTTEFNLTPTCSINLDAQTLFS